MHPSVFKPKWKQGGRGRKAFNYAKLEEGGKKKEQTKSREESCTNLKEKRG